MTHHEIDDFSKLDTKGNAMHFGLHEVSPLDGRQNGLNKDEPAN
jgi:hypothetical protein